MTLPGLIIAMTVSSGVLLTSVSLLQLAKEDFQHHHQAALLEDSAAFGLEIISRTVLQAVREDKLAPLETPDGSRTFSPASGAVQGIDNARISGNDTTLVPGINGSDILAINLSSPLGESLNCAGFNVPKASSAPAVSAWVMFYTAPGASGEPDLYCRYHGQKQWDSQAILSGVECFQVLFGLDTDDDGFPNQYLSPSALSEQEINQPNSSSSLRHRVVAVHVALLLRSATGGGKRLLLSDIDLFGSAYTQAQSLSDVGTAICAEDLSTPLRTRERLRIDTLIFLPEQGRAS